MAGRKRFDPNKVYKLDPSASPINPLPPVIVALALAMIGIEVVLQLGERGLIGGPEAIGWRLTLIHTFGFWDPVFEHMLTYRQVSPDAVWRFVTYPFVNPSPYMMIFGMVIMIATGNVIARVFASWAIIVAFLVTTAFAALVYGLWEDNNRALTGPFPAAYGFLGLYTWVLWMRARRKGETGWRAFSLIGFLLIFQCVRWFVIGQDKAIFSELAAFGVGFGLSFILAPERGARMRRWLEWFRGG